MSNFRYNTSTIQCSTLALIVFILCLCQVNASKLAQEDHQKFQSSWYTNLRNLYFQTFHFISVLLLDYILSIVKISVFYFPRFITSFLLFRYMDSIFDWIVRHFIKDKASVCSICLETLDQSILQRFQNLVCSMFWINMNPIISSHNTNEHYFHLACIIDWSFRQQTCPDCRNGMNTAYFKKVQQSIQKSLNRRDFIKNRILIPMLYLVLFLFQFIKSKTQLMISFLWEKEVRAIMNNMSIYVKEKIQYMTNSDIITFLTTDYTAELQPNQERQEHIKQIGKVYYQVIVAIICNILGNLAAVYSLKDKNGFWSWIISFTRILVWMLSPFALTSLLAGSQTRVLSRIFKQHKKVKFLQETQHIIYQLEKLWIILLTLLAYCMFGNDFYQFPLVLNISMTLVLGLCILGVLNVFMKAYEIIISKY